jgi:hypothetical protein
MHTLKNISRWALARSLPRRAAVDNLPAVATVARRWTRSIHALASVATGTLSPAARLREPKASAYRLIFSHARRTCLMGSLLLCMVCIPLSVSLADDSSAANSESLIVDDDFDKWDWIPIDFNRRRGGRNRIKEGRVLPFEHRGPLLRIADGFKLPSGRMLEDKEAYKGRSTLLEDTQVGLHDRYSSIIRPDTRYRWSVAVKGKGSFQFRAWVGANNLKSGEFRWLGFPNLIEVKASKDWKVHEGVFQLPELSAPGFLLPEKVSAAIVIERSDRVAVDAFRVWQIK